MKNKFKAIPLNCAAANFILGAEKDRIYTVRFSAELNESIDGAAIQSALEYVVNLYPYFFVKTTAYKNFFALAPIVETPKAENVTRSDRITEFNPFSSCLSRLTYCGKEIIFEFFHAVSDGTGGLEFFSKLINEYLRLMYPEENFDDGIIDVSKIKQPEDGYKKFAKGLSFAKRNGETYAVKGEVEEDGANVFSFDFAEDDVKTLASRYGVTVTEFLAGILGMSIADVERASEKKSLKKIRLNIPVDLRRRFNFDTSANFTLNAPVEIPINNDPLLCVCDIIHNELCRETTPAHLAARCASVTVAYNAALMLVPSLTLKKSLVKSALSSSAARGSMTFSSLGAIHFPVTVGKRVSDIRFMFTYKPDTLYSCSALSYKGRLRVTFFRKFKEPIVENMFARRLKEVGLEYKEEQHKW